MSSVITLTEGVDVDGHDCRHRHYVASRRKTSRDYASARGANESLGAQHSEFAVDVSTALGSALASTG